MSPSEGSEHSETLFSRMLRATSTEDRQKLLKNVSRKDLAGLVLLTSSRLDEVTRSYIQYQVERQETEKAVQQKFSEVDGILKREMQTVEKLGSVIALLLEHRVHMKSFVLAQGAMNRIDAELIELGVLTMEPEAPPACAEPTKT